MKTLLLLPKLFVAICILMLVACNTSASDTKTSETSQSENLDSENVESVQMPEKENWKTFEDRRSGITFSHPADWKVIIEDDIVIFEASFGHLIFHNISVPADELHVNAEEMFEQDDNYVEASRTQYSKPDRYMSIGKFKDGPSSIVQFLVAYPEYGLMHWELISDQEDYDPETIYFVEDIIGSVKFTNVKKQDGLSVTDSDSQIETLDVKDDISVPDSGFVGKETWYTPSLDVLSEHPEIACLNEYFSMFVDVFGVYIVATSDAPMNYVVHTANVLAQYIDNDADGMPDDLVVLDHLVDNKFVVPVWSSGGVFGDSDAEKFFEKIRGTDCEDSVRMGASMYYDMDEWALGGMQQAGTWDTNLEEVWHVISNGWYESYPDYFGVSERIPSMLTDAMDVARGGKFISIPERYPENAWYTYDDESCQYDCMAAEYFYWVLMANLDALDPAFTDKCESSEDEWYVCTQAQLAQVDPLAHSLLNDYDFALPTTIPDGNYLPSANYLDKDIIEDNQIDKEDVDTVVTSSKADWHTPDMEIITEHPEISCLNDVFGTFIDVFGVYVIAPSNIPIEFVLHTANVLAEYIDNDEDGMPDDQAVLARMIDSNLVMPVWTEEIREAFWPSVKGTYCEDNIRTSASMYYGGDEWALGGIESAGTWDTNLEEVWHIVTGGGWAIEYPEYFGLFESSNSLLGQAMDKARGGRFSSVPTKYPDSAWYTNEEGEYPNQSNEYLYWIMMTNLGALDPSLTNKCETSNPEWKVCTKEKLAQIDPLAHSLLNDYDFALPTIIPNGTYTPSKNYLENESISSEPIHSVILKGQSCVDEDIPRHKVQMTDALIDCLIEASKSEDPPVVLSGQSMDESVVRQVEEALDYGVELLGSWGPVYNVLVGINDPDSFVLAHQICSIYHTNGHDWFGHEPPDEPTLESCIENIGTTFSNYDCCGAVHNPPAPLHPVALQSVLYSGADVSGAEGRLPITVLHEYVHVFQNAQTVWPNELDSDENGRIRVYNHGAVWLEEGSAEFFAQYFAGQKGWGDYRANMKRNLLSARDVRSRWGLSLRDVVTRDGQARVRELCDCGGQLYYETGTWAAAWLVNRSGIDEFLFDYFPRLSYDGWEVTFKNVFDLTMDEFYDEFDAFLDQPIEQQMAILP
ncbi:MAG: hypothetical protein ACJ0HE_02775 [Anaerolineales bacterium]